MVYELVLTDSCNRHCPFCYVKHNGYVETEENIKKFINHVKQTNQDKNERFSINLFGGEPFLNYRGIKMVCDNFLSDYRCNILIITNGDLITKENIEEIRKCSIHLSTYDIFDKSSWSRYSWIYNQFKNSICQYTITADDIEKVHKLKEIYRTLGMNYHLRFSHDPDSWKSMSESEIYDAVYKLTLTELDEYITNFSNLTPRAQDFLDYHLIRYCAGLFDRNMEENFCAFNRKQCGKLSFYKGEFVGPCIRLIGKQLDFSGLGCKSCRHYRICSKSCFAEITNFGVNSKLCSIEKARFDAIYFFMNSGNSKIPLILQFYKDHPHPV